VVLSEILLPLMLTQLAGYGAILAVLQYRVKKLEENLKAHIAKILNGNSNK
jgi:hypothetical protein